MLFRKKLCYQCVSKRQNAKSCSDRKICRACNGKHPTTLNCSKEDSGKKPEEIASAENLKEDNKISSASVNSVNMGSNVISMSDVLVKAGYEGTGKVFHTYALLENCSQGTFATKDIVKKLGITGTPTSVTIKALNGDLTNQSLIVEWLKVKATAESDHCKCIKLPKFFSCDELPAETHDVAIPDKIIMEIL